jgi:hypothetical protein
MKCRSTENADLRNYHKTVIHRYSFATKKHPLPLYYNRIRQEPILLILIHSAAEGIILCSYYKTAAKPAPTVLAANEFGNGVFD